MNSREVTRQVYEALNQGGKRECRTRRTKSSGRVHYVVGEPGFRFHTTIDTPLGLPSEDGPLSHEYLGVGVAGNSLPELRSYAEILNQRGLQTVIGGTTRSKVPRVWVTIPIQRDLDGYICGWLRETESPRGIPNTYEYATGIVDILLRLRLDPMVAMKEIMEMPQGLKEAVVDYLCTFDVMLPPYRASGETPRELLEEEVTYLLKLYQTIRDGFK